MQKPTTETAVTIASGSKQRRSCHLLMTVADKKLRGENGLQLQGFSLIYIFFTPLH